MGAPPRIDGSSGWTTVIECPHGFPWRVDIAHLRNPRRLVDECSMALFERELASKNRGLGRRKRPGPERPDTGGK